MKSTGIVRHVDNLDRIVIPKELCRTLGIEAKSPLEIFVEGSRVILKRHEAAEISAGSKGNVGIIRRVDGLDRIVIPKEICKILRISPKDSMEIFVENDKIILGKYEPDCIFCGEVNNVIQFKRKLVCESCLKELKKIL